MDIAIHWGVFKHLRKDVKAQSWVLISAIVLDAFVLAAFLIIKGQTDLMIIIIAFVAIGLIFLLEKVYLKTRRNQDHGHSHDMH